MAKLESLPNMGVILCANCGGEIETISTPKVTTFYADCNHCNCQKNSENQQNDLERWD